MAENQTPVGTPENTTPQTPVADTTPKPVLGASSASIVQPTASKEPVAALPAQPREVGPDDEIGDEDKFTISSKAFKERLGRAQRRILKEITGTDDPAKAKQLVSEYQQLKQQAEERRLSEMTELEREKERRKQKEREFKEFKRSVHKQEVSRAVNEVEGVVTGIVKDVIRDKSMKHAIRDFQEAVSQMSEEDADTLYNADSIREWFQNYAKEYECGKELPPVQEPLNVGAGNKDSKPRTPVQPHGGKLDFSTKGGKSKKEVNDALKRMGLSVRV